MNEQLELFSCVHHWMIDSEKIGRCKCGAIRDFTEADRRYLETVEFELRKLHHGILYDEGSLDNNPLLVVE